MILTINNKEYEYKENTSLEEISKDFSGYKICAKVNNRIRELSYKISKDSTIEFLDLKSGDAMKIYQATLRYLVAMGVKELFKDTDIRFSNSISMSLFAKLEGRVITKNEIELLENKIREYIKNDVRFERKKYPISEMVEYYKSMGYLDKIETLKYRNQDVNIYECGSYKNYMYSYMAPSASYIKDFKFIPYHPGFMIQFPRMEAKGYIPQFVDEPNFLRALANESKWCKITNSENIYDINKKVENYDELIKFIGMCETRHSHDINEIGSRIEKNIDEIRLIAIAGPSSSGKTTFSKKLEIELLSRNIHPMRISLDNYYLPSEKCPVDEDGNPDFEHVDALNIQLFNENMMDFLSGNEVRLPVFDFKKRKQYFLDPVKLSKDGVIIIEGIHALNSKLTMMIPKENIFKIYIVPLAQRNIDNHNPISLTDLRLVRRIVRDRQFRNTEALNTLIQWKSVRNGERRWIYPNMEDADYIFNSELGYELSVLKKHGMESLGTVPNDSSQYIRANLLMKFLKVFKDIPDEYVKNSSLLREFIGGSIFKE